MALHDNPPHSVDTYTVNYARDTGGGSAPTYTIAQTALPCSINTLGSGQREIFGQQGMEVSHVIGILTSSITTAFTRGMKIITTDTAKSFFVRGISAGRSYGNIPAFTYLYCQEQL